jgi:hypothetical protein
MYPSTKIERQTERLLAHRKRIRRDKDRQRELENIVNKGARDYNPLPKRLERIRKSMPVPYLL